jgi:predicted  nucleic acid-binding Zn-ribbon protein
MNELLLTLQSVDTQIDQLTHRLGVVPELAAAKANRQEMMAWEAERQRMLARTAELETQVESAEQQAAELDMHKMRLSGQLRTVIAPREAEALQSEMKTLSDRRDVLDEQELDAMEEMSDLEIQMAEHAARESTLREALGQSDEALNRIQTEISIEVDALRTRREELRAGVPAEILSRYDHLRSSLGVAVAPLLGRRCEGCHMDLSPVEVDIVKAVPAGQLAECPQCTRILVR